MVEKRGKLLLVREREAEGRAAEIFSEIKQALGIPFVPVFYQALAAYPAFLDQHWRAFSPLVSTNQFFHLADRLRGEAYTRMHNYFQISDLCEPLTEMSFTEGAKHQLGDVIDLFNYTNPLLLVIVSAQLLAFEQPIGADVIGQAAGAEHPRLLERPTLVEEKVAAAPVKKIYEEMKRALGVPVVNTDYRAFARWPDFLREYWKALRPIVQAPSYREQQRGLCESSEAMVRELTTRLDFSPDKVEEMGLDDKQLESALRVTQTFQNVLSGLMLNVAAAKIGFEGGTTKVTSDREFAA
jgi:halocarboxylic acid dehydrogenase DehI